MTERARTAREKLQIKRSPKALAEGRGVGWRGVASAPVGSDTPLGSSWEAFSLLLAPLGGLGRHLGLILALLGRILSPRWRNIAPRWPNIAHFFAKMRQHSPTWPPRSPNLWPRSPKIVSKSLQRDPRDFKKAPKVMEGWSFLHFCIFCKDRPQDHQKYPR